MRISAFCASAFLCGSLLAANKDPGDLLHRIREKMTIYLAQLPNYTCREVIDRTVRHGSVDIFRPVDEIRLAVAFVGGRELYAKDARHRFEETGPEKFTSGGSIANGSFGTHARILFGGDSAEFHYGGEEKLNHRKAYRFDFSVPLAASQYQLRGAGVAELVPYHGSIWADEQTLDLMQIKVEVTRIPPALKLAQVEQVMRYDRIKIGGSSFLLPRKAELLTEDIYGNAARNSTKFDQCQEFVGDSIVRYGPVVREMPGAESADRAADPR